MSAKPLSIIPAPEERSIWRTLWKLFVQAVNVTRYLNEARRWRSVMATAIIALEVAERDRKHLRDVHDQNQEQIKTLEERIRRLQSTSTNAQCPVCAHFGNTVRPVIDEENKKVGIVHTCGNCGFNFSGEPLLENAFEWWVKLPKQPELTDPKVFREELKLKA